MKEVALCKGLTTFPIFGLTIMPETRGRTLEEIGSSWGRRSR